MVAAATNSVSKKNCILISFNFYSFSQIEFFPGAQSTVVNGSIGIFKAEGCYITKNSTVMNNKKGFKLQTLNRTSFFYSW